MIKRTLYFGNPAYLKTRDEQLLITLPDGGSQLEEKMRTTTIPIEDIGVVILDHQQITISQALISKLLANNAALITCDNSHHPTGLFLNLNGNTLQAERFATQLEASVPLKKQLWQQTVEAKIYNQALLLQHQNREGRATLFNLCKEVRSGDPDNVEGRAAAVYWKNLFGTHTEFIRGREGEYPNNLLNYGYAILRAITARSLVGSGLLPTFGIHHRNKYNAYCLADDIMEPYRPVVDKLVCTLYQQYPEDPGLTTTIKQELLQIPVLDVWIDGVNSPLATGMAKTTAALVKCFEGSLRKIPYPELRN